MRNKPRVTSEFQTGSDGLRQWQVTVDGQQTENQNCWSGADADKSGEMVGKVGVPRKTEKKICGILRGLLPRKKVRMNIVQGGPASLGGKTDNCFRESVYLKDRKAEEVF